MTTFFNYFVTYKERTIKHLADYVFDFFLSIKDDTQESFTEIDILNAKHRKIVNVKNNDSNRLLLAEQLLDNFRKDLKKYENNSNPTIDTVLAISQVHTVLTKIRGKYVYISFNIGKEVPCSINFFVRDTEWEFFFHKSLFKDIIIYLNPIYAYEIPWNLKRRFNYVDLPRNLYVVGWLNYFSKELELNELIKVENKELFNEGVIISSVNDVFNEENIEHIQKAEIMFDYFQKNSIVM